MVVSVETLTIMDTSKMMVTRKLPRIKRKVLQKQLMPLVTQKMEVNKEKEQFLRFLLHQANKVAHKTTMMARRRRLKLLAKRSDLLVCSRNRMDLN